MSGRATSSLKESVKYIGSMVSFTQLLGSMEEDGEISRQIRGKRTYAIGLGPNGKSAHSIGLDFDTSGHVEDVPGTMTSLAVSGPSGQIDYAELASALLLEVVGRLRENADVSTEAAWNRRVEEFDLTNSALQRELSRALQDAEAFKAERDELQERLAATTRNLEIIKSQLETGETSKRGGRRNQSAAAISNEDKQLLDRFVRLSSSESSEVG